MTGPQHVIGICGGAVAGSEAAALCAERGALVVVIDQNPRPYGKIEDGLPRWHDSLQRKEYGRIDANLTHPNILYVPNTRLGRDLAYHELTDEMGLSAVILATGAWRDRRLTSVAGGLDDYVNKGLVYQNSFVYWFNHYHQPGYAGPRYEVPDGTLVVGGGLASIDVVKIVNLELYARALRKRGHDIDIIELEHGGIDKTLRELDIAPESLGVKGCTLFYRRDAESMPLATADNPTPERLEKLKAARVKILDKVMRNFFVTFEPLSVAHAPIVEQGRMHGLEFARTRLEGRKVVRVEGSQRPFRGDLVISSIGSIPDSIDGLPMRGELYAFQDWDTGALEPERRVFGLGNVLTGKGNIKDSRKNAREVAERLLSAELGLTSETPADLSDALHAGARADAEPTVQQALSCPPLAAERVEAVRSWVRRRWDAIGYDGDYAAWIKDSWPR